MTGHHRSMLHAWVQHRNSKRVGQVKGVYRDPDTGKQAGVFVYVGKERLFWPTDLIHPTRAPKKGKGRRSWRNSKS